MKLTKFRLQFDEIIGYNNREFNDILWAWVKRNASNISNLVEAEVKPESTDIEKQENIVTILSDMITEIADRREILDTHFNCEYTHQEGRIIGSALKKLLALDNLKVITIE